MEVYRDFLITIWKSTETGEPGGGYHRKPMNPAAHDVLANAGLPIESIFFSSNAGIRDGIDDDGAREELLSAAKMRIDDLFRRYGSER